MNKDASWGDTQKLLAFILVISFIIVIVIWMFHPPSADSTTTPVLYTLVGTLGGLAGTVVTFYFGSSKGSKDKDDTQAAVMTTMLATHPTNGAAATLPITTTALPAAPAT